MLFVFSIMARLHSHFKPTRFVFHSVWTSAIIEGGQRRGGRVVHQPRLSGASAAKPSWFDSPLVPFRVFA